MSEIKVRISETKYRSFYKTLIEGDTNIRDECPVGDNRATLNIRHCVNNIMSQLVTILQVPAHIMVTNDTLVLRAEVEYDKCGCR